jgi:two-component system sensor histidine kinase KdpD
MNVRRFAPVLASFGGPLLATAPLMLLDDGSGPEPEHLVFIYLVPASLIAIVYGSASSIVAATVSALCATFFLYHPRFSFIISKPTEIAELLLFFVLALAQTAFIGRLVHDRSVERRRGRAAEMSADAQRAESARP